MSIGILSTAGSSSSSNSSSSTSGLSESSESASLGAMLATAFFSSSLWSRRMPSKPLLALAETRTVALPPGWVKRNVNGW